MWECVCVCVRCVWRGEEVCLIKREKYFKKANSKIENKHMRVCDDPLFHSPSFYSPAPSATVVLIHWLHSSTHTHAHKQTCTHKYFWSTHSLLVKTDTCLALKYQDRLIISVWCWGEERLFLFKEEKRMQEEDKVMLSLHHKPQHFLSNTFTHTHAYSRYTLHQTFICLQNNLQLFCYYLLPPSGCWC